MKKKNSNRPPAKIWLQWYGDKAAHAISDTDDVTFTTGREGKIFENDIEYIRVRKNQGLSVTGTLDKNVFQYLLTHDGADDEAVQNATGASLRDVGDAIDRLIKMKLITREGEK